MIWRDNGKYGVESSSGKNTYFVKQKDGSWRKAGKLQKAIAKHTFKKYKK